ncbi:DNA polymerase III subunit delta [Candidatus Saccharibacteria bacterium]|nr:DNA polymerase III subunit delta [Candidatus Saccharibacteria bacterium]
MIVTAVGENVFERAQFVAELKADFIAKYGNDGVEEYDGDKLEVGSLGSLLGGVSLFASHRLVIVRNLSENSEVAEKLLDKLADVPDEVILLLIETKLDKRTALYKTLKKDTDFHEFMQRSDAEVERWILDEVKRQGGDISTREARLLREYCGNDQSRLFNEIAKLTAYDTHITHESIELLVDKNPSDTVFELLESAMSGRRAAALKKLVALERAHEDPYQIASMLVWQAHIMAIVLAADVARVSEGEVAKDHKINPYVVKKSHSLVSRVSPAGVKKIVARVAELDTRLKTGTYSPWRAIENTIVQLG